MKKIVNLLMCSLVFVNLMGCADKAAYTQYNDTFEKNANGYYAVAGKPLMDMTLPAPDGKEYHLVVNREVKPLIPQQIKDSEWTGAVIAGIAGASTVGLGVIKWKMTESDNDRMIRMNASDNEARTTQLHDYVSNFKSEKETFVETTSSTESVINGATSNSNNTTGSNNTTP